MTTKAMRRADRELRQEINRQIDLVYGAGGIALHNIYGFGEKRVAAVFEQVQNIWSECGSDIRLSMPQMLEDETGIELRESETGKSWHDFKFFQYDPDEKLPTAPEYILMRKRQKQWMPVAVLAAFLLALHRMYGFGTERLQRVAEGITEEQTGYRHNPAALRKACKETTGVAIEGEVNDRKSVPVAV